MRKSIHKLDPDIANKIAAGEVVERPAAVVKELVENAIDAGAKNITIDIEKAGRKKIRITDDGEGLTEKEVDLAFERHATSKIDSVEDIYNIKTLGFRGEALASISAVSRMEVVTRTADGQTGIQLLLTAGRSLEKKQTGCPVGTTMVVKDLFFNTPARLKFLKTDRVETTAIHDIVNKLALSHSHVGFRYIVDGKHMFTTTGSGDLFHVIHSVYEKDMAHHLIKIESKGPVASVNGYISHLEYTRGNKSLQTFFVNGRYVKSPVLLEALSMAYKPMQFPGRFPICFLMVDVPFDKVDVNIHPAKTEIKFHDEGLVKQAVYKAVRSCLLAYNQTPRVSPKTHSPMEEDISSHKQIKEKKEEEEFQTKTSIIYKEASDHEHSHEKNYGKSFEKTYEKPFVFTNKKFSNEKTSSKEKVKGPVPFDVEQQNTFSYAELNIQKKEIESLSYEQMPLVKETLSSKGEVYENMNYLGSLFSTYLLFEKNDRLYMIDQHAAHEKVLYERFLGQYKKKGIDRQILLDPLLVHLSYGEYETAKISGPLYEEMGLFIEDFGKDTILIREIPVLLDRQSAQTYFLSINTQLGVGGISQNLTDTQKDKIAQMACKAAIKAHDHIGQREILSLLDQLKALNDPYTCPHGRPIVISMTQAEIERKFKRT